MCRAYLPAQPLSVYEHVLGSLQLEVQQVCPGEQVVSLEWQQVLLLAGAGEGAGVGLDGPEKRGESVFPSAESTVLIEYDDIFRVEPAGELASK